MILLAPLQTRHLVRIIHHTIHPEGFKLKQQYKYYVIQVLMFGVNYAVFITNRLLKIIKIFLQSHGIGIYIDDGRVISNSHNLCKSQIDLALTVLHGSGWLIQWKKTSTVPFFTQGVSTVEGE